ARSRQRSSSSSGFGSPMSPCCSAPRSTRRSNADRKSSACHAIETPPCGGEAADVAEGDPFSDEGGYAQQDRGGDLDRLEEDAVGQRGAGVDSVGGED